MKKKTFIILMYLLPIAAYSQENNSSPFVYTSPEHSVVMYVTVDRSDSSCCCLDDDFEFDENEFGSCPAQQLHAEHSMVKQRILGYLATAVYYATETYESAKKSVKTIIARCRCI